MNITIDIPDSLLMKLGAHARDEGCTIEELIIVKCSDAADLESMTSEQLDDRAVMLREFLALNYGPEDGPVTLRDVSAFMGYPFDMMLAGDCKALGKRFAALVGESCIEQGYTITAVGKTQTNARLYLVTGHPPAAQVNGSGEAL